MFLVGCENAHEPMPIVNCSSSNPATYTSDVKQIVDVNCVSGCHTVGGSYGSILLRTSAEVKAAVENKNLLKAIRHDSGFASMPQYQAKLSQSNIDKITCWVDNGFKN